MYFAPISQATKYNYLDDKFQAAYKWEDFKKNSDGMVPVIVQDYRTSVRA